MQNFPSVTTKNYSYGSNYHMEVFILEVHLIQTTYKEV